MLAEVQALGLPRQRRGRDDRRLGLRLLPLVVLRKIAEQHVGDDESEQRVAEELERLVVDDAAAHVLVRARGVRHRVLEQPAVAEAIADRLLQRLELVAQAHDLPVLQLGAVRLDDPLRFVRFAFVHRNPDFVEAVDGERENRAGHVGGDERHDAVRLQEAAHDPRLDVGVRAEDHDQIARRHVSLRAPRAARRPGTARRPRRP